MLNELKKSSLKGDVRLRGRLRSVLHLGYPPERLADIFVDTLNDARAELVEKCRARLLERMHEEAWKAAIRWRMLREMNAPTMPVNTALGTAVACASLVSFVENDGELADFLFLGEDEHGYGVVLGSMEDLMTKSGLREQMN